MKRLPQQLLIRLVAAVAAMLASAVPGAAQSRTPRIVPCKLLTDAQVKSVVPDLADSMTVSNGESLMKTVETYQCSHVNTSDRSAARHQGRRAEGRDADRARSCGRGEGELTRARRLTCQSLTRRASWTRIRSSRA